MHIIFNVSHEGFKYLEHIMEECFMLQRIRYREHRKNPNVFVYAHNGNQFRFHRNEKFRINKTSCLKPAQTEFVMVWTKDHFQKIRKDLSKRNLLISSLEGTLRLRMLPEVLFRWIESMDEEYYQSLRER